MMLPTMPDAILTPKLMDIPCAPLFSGRYGVRNLAKLLSCFMFTVEIGSSWNESVQP